MELNSNFIFRRLSIWRNMHQLFWRKRRRISRHRSAIRRVPSQKRRLTFSRTSRRFINILIATRRLDFIHAIPIHVINFLPWRAMNIIFTNSFINAQFRQYRAALQHPLEIYDFILSLRGCPFGRQLFALHHRDEVKNVHVAMFAHCFAHVLRTRKAVNTVAAGNENQLCSAISYATWFAINFSYTTINTVNVLFLRFLARAALWIFYQNDQQNYNKQGPHPKSRMN